jgi:putative PEP-CTERM system TPR-repeat lipoprotein
MILRNWLIRLLNQIFTILIILGSVSASAQQNSDINYERALQAFNNGNIEEAYIHLKNTLKENDEHVPGKILIGKILLQNKYYPDVVLELNEALALGGDMELIIQPLAEALFNLRRYQDVLVLADNHRLSKTAMMSLSLWKAKAYARLGQPENELSQYNIAYRLDPNAIEVLNQLTAYYINQQKTVKAQEIINKIVDSARDDFFTWHLQGLIYKHNQQFDKAKSIFAKVLTIEPDYIDSKRALASIYIEQDDDMKALGLINEVLEQNPNDPRASLLKANLLFKTNQSESAEVILNLLNQQLSVLNDDVIAENAWIHFVNAVSAFLLKNYELSIRESSQYLSKKPNNLHAISLLTQSYIKLGQRFYALELLDNKAQIIKKDKQLTILLCDLYIENNRATKCNELLLPYVESLPSDVDIVLAYSRLLSNQKNNQKAIELLEKNNEKSRVIEYENYLITLYMLNNQPAKAAFLTNKLLNEFPDNLELMNAMTAALIQMELFPQAFQVTQDILSQDSNYLGANYNQASVLLKMGKANEAKIILERLISQHKQHIQVRLLLSDAEMALGDLKAAIAVLTAIMNIDPTHIQAQEKLVMLYKLSGQNERALTSIDNLIRKNRLMPDYIKTKAEILMALGKHEQLKRQCNILIGLWSDDPIKLVELSKLQRMAGDLVGARKAVNLAIELTPQSKSVLFADAEIAIYENKDNAAMRKLQNLKRLVKDDPNVITLEGDMLLFQRKVELAQDRYITAFSMDMTNGMALVKAYNLAKSGFHRERFEQEILKSLTIYPNNHYYRNLLADYYLLAKRMPDAQQHYLKIINADNFPNKADVLNNLANTFMRSDLNQAYIYAKKANELKPSSPAILDTYGWVLAQQMKYAPALAILRKAHSLDVNDNAIGFHLAFTLFQLDRIQEASALLDKVLRSPVHFDERESALELSVKIKV